MLFLRGRLGNYELCDLLGARAIVEHYVWKEKDWGCAMSFSMLLLVRLLTAQAMPSWASVIWNASCRPPRRHLGRKVLGTSVLVCFFGSARAYCAEGGGLGLTKMKAVARLAPCRLKMRRKTCGRAW